MSAFVTETLSEDLSVLIFSQSNALADLLATELQKHNLDVTRKSSDIASLDQFLENSFSSTWYKVFWIDDIEHLSIEKAKRISKIFQSMKGLSYVVMHQPFNYSGLKNFDVIGKTLSEIDTFFAQRSPYTSLLTYKDVLTNEFFSLDYQQIVHLLHGGKFPYVQEEFSFLSESEMIEGVISLSFDPRGGKRRVVVNKKPWLVRAALKAIQSEFRRRFKGEEVFINTELNIDFSSDFKLFPVPSRLEAEEMVSELIVEAKFHYKPEPEKEKVSSNIPKPHIPKPTPVDQDLHRESRMEKQETAPEIEVKEESRIVPEKVPENIDEEVPPKPKTVFKEKKTVEPVAFPDMEVLLRPLLKSPLIESGSSVRRLSQNIQETSIQVRVTAPLSTISRAPVMIPEQQIPEIRRSKFVLSQLASLEKPVEKAPQVSIPYLNKHVMERVQHEQQIEKNKTGGREEVAVDEQKKQLEKKIAHLFSGTIQSQGSKIKTKQRTPSPIQVLFGPETRVGKWYRTKKKIVFFLSLVSVTTIILVGTFFVNQIMLQRDLVKVVDQFTSRSPIDAKMMGRVAFSQGLLDKQLSVYSSVLGTSVFSDLYGELEFSHKLTSLQSDIAEMQRLHVKAVRQILGAEEGNALQTLTPALTKAENIYKQLSVVEAELKQNEQNSFLSEHLTTAQQEELVASLSEVRREVLVGQQLTEILPTIFSDQKRTVAVVIQDSAELRATGGFVQSIALLTFEQGKLTDVKMLKPDDISTALSGIVAPPEEITQFLKETQWFVRDANWNPDFEVTAKQIAWFLDKGTGTQVDGVVALNTSSLAQIVGVFGSVKLTDFGDAEITDKNLSERAFSSAKASLTENDPALSDKNFLESVFVAVMAKAKKIDEPQAAAAMTAISDSLKQSEIVLSLTSPSAEATLATLGWTGKLMSPPCPAQLAQEQCVVSRMFQVDSNVGVNKVNDVVKKKVEHATEIKPDKIVHKRVITYENSSATNSWPGGSYKNYIRWYTPLDTKIRLISVNSKEIPMDQIKQYQDKTSQVFGTLIEVLPQSTIKVVIEYEEAPLQSKSSFVFFDQKQPGTMNTPTNITFFYGSEYVPTVIAPDAKVSDDKVEFTFVGDQHRFVGVKFK